MKTGYTEDRDTFRWADVLRAAERVQRETPAPELAGEGQVTTRAEVVE